MITVSVITKTCNACPSQWEGVTDDGREVYVRYRFGFLYIKVGDERVFERLLDEDRWEGMLDYDELKVATVGIFDWPMDEMGSGDEGVMTT